MREEELPYTRDYRLQNVLKCVQCGKCTGTCTASTIYYLARKEGREIGEVYNPRKITALLREHPGLTYTGGPLAEQKSLLERLFDISECVQCGLCELQCPKGNSPRDLIKYYQELNADGAAPHPFREEWLKHGCVNDKLILQILPLSNPHKGRELTEAAIRELNDLISNAGRYNLAPPRENRRVRTSGTTEEVSEVFLFQGCSGATAYRGMEIGARYLLDHLGIKIHVSDAQTCCGGVPFNINELTLREKLLVNARNLAVMEEMLSNTHSHTVIGTCATCVQSSVEVKNMLSNEQNKRAINGRLSTVGKHVDGDLTIQHIAELLHTNLDRIKENVAVRLKGLKVAIHSGCHAREVTGEKINHKLHDLVEATGATVVDYPLEMQCCGSGPKIFKDSFAGNKNVGILYTVPSGPNWRDFWGGSSWFYINRANPFGLGGRQLRFVSGSLRQTAEKFKSMVCAGANMIVVDCPGCEKTFDKNQGIISKKIGRTYGLPTSHIAEFLAIAMGADHTEIFNAQYHSVPIEPVLELYDLI